MCTVRRFKIGSREPGAAASEMASKHARRSSGSSLAPNGLYQRRTGQKEIKAISFKFDLKRLFDHKICTDSLVLQRGNVSLYISRGQMRRVGKRGLKLPKILSTWFAHAPKS